MDDVLRLNVNQPIGGLFLDRMAVEHLCVLIIMWVHSTGPGAVSEAHEACSY